MKRNPGRPRSAKTRLMITIDPAVLRDFDERARAYGLSRSAYIEVVLRAEIARKESPFTRRV